MADLSGAICNFASNSGAGLSSRRLGGRRGAAVGARVASTGPAPARPKPRLVRTREVYRLSAILVNKRTKEPISEARVEAWDADGRCTDLLAFTRADASGHFNLTLSEGAVVGLLADRKPAIELHVFSSEGAPLPDPAWRWQLGAAVTHARVEVDADGTAPTRAPTNCFVRGHVRTPRGAPVSGAMVHLNCWPGTLLPSMAVSDARGAYEIAYPVDAPAEILVYVTEGREADSRVLAQSPKYCHAPPTLTVDMSIGGAFRGASEWEELQATVSPRDIEAATDDELDLLACRVGVSREQIGHLAAAKRLSSGVNVGEEALYGLLRAGLPSDAVRLLRTHPKEVRRRLQRAVDKNHVRAAVGGGIEATIRRFRAAARTAMLTLDEGPVTTVGGVLRAALPLEDAETFVEEYLAHEGAPEDFWAALPRKKGFERGEVTQRVRFALQAAWLSSPSSLAADVAGSCPVRQSAIPAKKLPAIDPEARFFKPLVVRLLEDRTNGSIRSLKDLARFTDAQFASLVEDVGAPDETPGRSAAARKAYYAEQLKQTLREAFPTAAIAAAIEAEAPEGHEDLTTFLNDRANDGFAFGETRVATHVAKTTGALARISTRTSSETVENLKAIERAYRLTQDSTQAVRLYKNGIRSAAQVQALGVDGLVDATGVAVESARAIVGRACAISGGAIALPRTSMFTSPFWPFTTLYGTRFVSSWISSKRRPMKRLAE